MEKRPVLLRTLLCLVVIAIFSYAMYPLAPRDYFETFTSLLKDKKDPKAAELIKDAKKRMKENPDLFESQALQAAADESNVNLVPMVKGKDLQNNADVMSLIRKKASSKIRLGLDLHGGVEFYLKMVPDKNRSAEEQEEIKNDFDRHRDAAIEQLRSRLEQMRIFEAEFAPSGSEHIVLRAPIVTNDEKAKLRNVIEMSARLEFRLVKADQTPEEIELCKKDPANIPAGYELMSYTEVDKNGTPQVRTYLVSENVEMDGKNIRQARPFRDQFGICKISLSFNSKGAEQFHAVTKKYQGRALAIVLDGKLYCAPNINEPIAGGGAEISGSFTQEEAETVANALQAGNFPYTIEVSAVFDTDPKLGAASVKSGIYTGIISLIFVSLFMIAYYRLSGCIAVLGLGINMLLILGAMAAFGSTLTLPGIAGIVLTIGMAVDANVLVFERIREELAKGKSLKLAIDSGYSRALSAVLDANITTLVTAFILMYVGTGAIKGFAVTLSIGIITSLFTTLVITRLLYDYLLRYTKIQSLKMLYVFKATKYDFIKIWKYALAFSALLVLLTVVMFCVRGKGMLGIDFTGGTAITYKYAKKGNTSQIAKVLKQNGYREPQVTYKSNSTAPEGEQEKLELLFRNESDPAQAIKTGELLAKNFPELKIEPKSAHLQNIDGLIGAQFTRTAILAVVLALIGLGLYIVLRYEFVYAVSSVLALLHDVVAILGIYLLMGKNIGLTTIAAFLTVIGYSINDTVVIFDRLRENLKLNQGAPLPELINLSINQTLSRTFLTSLTTFITTFALYLFGGPEIQDFVFVMMLGVILGTYSSVFLAAPMVNFLSKFKKGKQVK